MPFWCIRPEADLMDPRWQDHAIYDMVMIRADTPALARVVAAAIEYAEEKGEPPTGNESGTFSSAFLDEKLYHVARMDEGAAEAYGGEDGPPAVLYAHAILARSRP